MVANIHLLAPLMRQLATIKPPIDAVKLSNTIQLSPNYIVTLLSTFPLGFITSLKYQSATLATSLMSE
jgi:hypothetical protein